MAVLNQEMITNQLETLRELYSDELPRIIKKKANIDTGIIRRVYAVGNGDSFHAALCASEAFREWTDIEYIPMPANTFAAKEIGRMKEEAALSTLVVCVSASGSSKAAAEILHQLKERKLALTMSLTGCSGECIMDRNAETVFKSAVSEQGRTPGIRTFAASLCGLLSLGLSFAEDDALREKIASAVFESAEKVGNLAKTAEATNERASLWEWDSAMILGCDSLEGCSRFVAAKFAEGSGVRATVCEMEEWCHVESMTYPLTSPVVVLQKSASTEFEAKKIVETAKRAGHNVMLISDKAIDTPADEKVVLDVCVPDEIFALYAYIPLMSVVAKIGKKLGRGMFLSDQPFSLF